MKFQNCHVSALTAPPPPCVNDVIVAVDSSACFRDHHGRMMRFLKKLVRKIGRNEEIEYGSTKTRLGLMQVIFGCKFMAFVSQVRMCNITCVPAVQQRHRISHRTAIVRRLHEPVFFKTPPGRNQRADEQLAFPRRRLVPQQR